eukprot:CAMPEP_0114986232 /NCGR_PEP_ID=MMETSP0216-20121206/8313_1 /TAXON_ID=223996 /ORGANISM="Protocruzia adherens, Strain Boccale" /LENGTH=143 /DNA_ID=CAMNT_0002348647 /DNA_START=86 /DNA_END=517 /DNA_ORIENTATION=+
MSIPTLTEDQKTSYTKALSEYDPDKEVSEEAKGSLQAIVTYITQTGDVSPFTWSQLKPYLSKRIKETLTNMHSQCPDCKSDPGETFDDQLDLIMTDFDDLYQEEPPFTIQRICELLNQPEKHYISTRKLLHAFQKVISIGGSY